ncbi:hypothetical protein KFE25_014233 [Diacronema lutheri]|uniref:Uncharacterized protein n=1 Tax=Diacronema lutheri TaxID=2081491 RepID=A0A8J6CA41_DIALT|nr:hypothetical protein KFE25_014233 [Diacronema lutheri]
MAEFDEVWLAKRVAEIVARFGDTGKTMSDVRRQLAAEAGRSFDAVDDRARVKQLVLLASEQLAATAAKAAGSASESESESESSAETAPRKRPPSAKPTKPSIKRAQAEHAPAGGGALWESAEPKLLAKIIAARSVLKRAGLGARLASIKGVRTMPPADVLARLLALLATAGLSAKPSRQELADFKARRELERELDGIDAANVLGDRRRRRTADEDDAFCAPPPLERARRAADASDDDHDERDVRDGGPLRQHDDNCDKADADRGCDGSGIGSRDEHAAPQRKRRRRAVAESPSKGEGEGEGEGDE